MIAAPFRSVVVHEIHIHGLVGLEPEDYAPVPRHAGSATLQCIESACFKGLDIPPVQYQEIARSDPNARPLESALPREMFVK